MAANDGAPNPGPGDCYNRVTETCNSRLPGKDWGDQEYRDCINDGLKWCDVNEPSRVVVVPGFNSRGQLVKLNAFEKFYIKVFRR